MGSSKVPDAQKKFHQYKDRVAKAIQEKRIFRIIGTCGSKCIRECMLKRDWLELKIIPWHSISMQMSNISLTDEVRPGNEAESVLISKLVGDYTPDFVWTNRSDYYDIYKAVASLNRIQFTGINFCGKDQILYYIDKINKSFHKPEEHIYYSRSYEINTQTDVSHFRKQFKLTLITGLLLCLYENKPTTKYFCKLNDSVQVEGLDFALRIIEKCMNEFKQNPSCNKLLDTFSKCSKLTIIQWRQIYIAHEDIVKFDCRFRLDGDAVKDYVKRVKVCAEFLLQHLPRIHHEGYHNVYICKPAWVSFEFEH